MGILQFCEVICQYLKIPLSYRLVCGKKLSCVRMYEDEKKWQFYFFVTNLFI